MTCESRNAFYAIFIFSFRQMNTSTMHFQIIFSVICSGCFGICRPKLKVLPYSAKQYENELPIEHMLCLIPMWKRSSKGNIDFVRFFSVFLLLVYFASTQPIVSNLKGKSESWWKWCSFFQYSPEHAKIILKSDGTWHFEFVENELVPVEAVGNTNSEWILIFLLVSVLPLHFWCFSYERCLLLSHRKDFIFI